MRSRVLLMVALLAVAGVMAAMAYTSGEVRNPSTATAVSTEVALLALECADPEGTGFKDKNCEVEEDGRLHLNFAKGLLIQGTPGTDPVPQTTIKSVNATLKERTQGHGPNKKTFRWFEVAVKTSKNDTITFNTDEHQGSISHFQSRPKGHGEQCMEYRYRVGNKDQSWVEYCLPDDAVPGEEGTPGKSLYGFQPGSTYRFGDLVKVTNNSEDSVDISVEIPESWSTSGMDLDITSDGKDLTDPSSIIRLGPGGSTWISFSFTVPDEWGKPDKFKNGDESYPFSGMLTVNAVAVD